MDIRNCIIKFKCTKTWESLDETNQSHIRYCGDCDRGVHLCKTQDELKINLKNNRCVAVDIENEKSEPSYLVGDLMLNLN